MKLPQINDKFELPVRSHNYWEQTSLKQTKQVVKYSFTLWQCCWQPGLSKFLLNNSCLSENSSFWPTYQDNSFLRQGRDHHVHSEHADLPAGGRAGLLHPGLHGLHHGLHHPRRRQLRPRPRLPDLPWPRPLPPRLRPLGHHLLCHAPGPGHWQVGRDSESRLF